MRCGCPRSQGGAYSVFQHWSIVALSSPQDINARPLPVVHPEEEIQNNMVATQYSGELRVADSPGQLQQGYARSQQNLQGVHHQQESRATIVSTGFQHPIPEDGACTSWNSRHQISQDGNAGFYSSALHGSAQHRSYLGAMASGSALRQSVNNSGQQRKFSSQNVSIPFLKGSDLNNNTGLQRKQHLNCVSLAGTSSTALGDSRKVAAQKFPLQDQRSRVTASKKQISSPLLVAILTSDSKSYTTPPSSSDDPNANIDLNTQRHHYGQQVKSSLAALNWRRTETQNLDHSGGTTHQQRQTTPPSLSSQPFEDNFLKVGEREPPTDAEIYDFIKHAATTFKTGKWKTLPAFAMKLSTSVTAKEGVAKQSLKESAAAAGQALKKNCSKGSKANMALTPMFEETDAWTTSASMKHSPGTLVSAVNNSKNAPKSEFVKKSLSFKFGLSVKHLDVTMPANGDYKLVYSDVCEDKMLASINDESFHSKWCDKYFQNGMSTLRYSSAALKELIASLENVETFAEVENFSKVILQQYWNGNIDNVRLFASTEYPQIMREVAATCAKCKDGGPAGVPMVVPGATQDELTEKQPSSVLNHSSPQEEYVSSWLNISKNLDDIDQVPGVSWTPKHMMDKEKGETGLKPVQAVGWDGVQGLRDVSKDLPTKPKSTASELIDNTHKKANRKKRKNVDKHCSVTSKEAIAHSELDSPVDKIHITNIVSIPANQSEWLSDQRSDEDTREDVDSVYSQTDLSIALCENKVKKHAFLSESQEAHPQYEDISDNDTNISVCLKDPQYDDISDAECPHVETSQVLKPNNEQSAFQNEGHGHVQGRAPMKQVSPKTKTPEIAHHCSCSCFVGTSYGFDDVIYSKCDCKTQTNHSVSHGHSFDLKDEAETDDEMDYDCLVVSILDLKFEPEDEDQDSPETNVVESVETGDQERWCDSPTPGRPVLAIEFPQVPVYETKESFIQAVQCTFDMESGGSTPEHVMDKERTQNRRESVDNSDTEDSCDYSSASEYNYLTVSRQMLKKLAPQAPEMDVSSCKKEFEGDEVANAQKGQTKRGDKSGRLQKLKKFLAKAGSSKNVQPKTNGQQISKNNQEIVIVSDTEDESEQSFRKKAKRKNKKRFFSSDSENSEDAPCSRQERFSSGIVGSQCGTVKGRFQKDRLLSADSPAPQHQCKHGTLSEEVMEDKCSDLSHRTEKGKVAPEQGKHVIVIDSDTEEDYVQNYKKQSRNIFSSDSDSDDVLCAEPETEDSEDGATEETRPSSAKDKKIIPSSGTEDSGDDLFVTKKKLTVDGLCGAENKRLSSEDSPERWSVGRKVDSTMGSNPVIPRFIVVKPSPPKKSLILLKEHRLGKDGTQAPQTSIASRKKTGSCEKNKTDSCRINIAKDGHNATKNNVQADLPKPRMLSRQLSLPRQEGPCTSFSSLPSTSGQLTEARQRSFLSRSLSLSGETSASSSLPTSKQSASIPRHLPEPKLKQPHSYGASTLSSAPIHSEARQQIIKDWEINHVPTRWEKKAILGTGASRPPTGLCSEARPGPSHHDKAPRKRHNSHKSETPLMKKTKIVAIQRTKDINRDASKERRFSVGEGYKWSEKPTVAKPTKGPSQDGRKYRSPPRP